MMNNNPTKPRFLSIKLILALAVIDLLLVFGMLLTTGSPAQTPGEPTIEITSTMVAQVEATAALTGTVAITTTHIPTQTLQATETPKLAIDPFIEQTKIVNGIEIHLNNIRRGDNRLKADICFPMPNNEDWMLNRLSFRYDGKEIRDWEGLVIDPIIPAANGKPGRRCDTVYFRVSDQVSLSDFTITVVSIYAPPREGGMCQRAKIVQEKLHQQGIEINCQEEDNFGGYQIEAKPDSMSQEEAQEIILNEVNFTVQGPWEFNVHLP